MKTTNEMLDDIIEKEGLKGTDYSLWKYMEPKYNWSKQLISKYRKGQSHPDNLKSLQIANELKLDPMYVISCIEYERRDDTKTRNVWQQMANNLSHAAGVILIIMIIAPLATYSPISHAGQGFIGNSAKSITSTFDYYVKLIKDKLNDFSQLSLSKIKPFFSDNSILFSLLF